MRKLASNLVDWLDSRSGFRGVMREALYEQVPGGARWRYVWGSTLVMAFVTQLITGIFLWMAYSPSTQTAWESVFYIQFDMEGGWLLRGIHHFMAQAMIVLLAIHFVQVVWDGAYRAPRELNFLLGLILMLIVLGLSLTGYLLPWDQKGYWATNVGTELASQTPLAGGAIRKLVVGGNSYGHLTLTRFFALHAGILPGALIAFLAIHLALFRRHGITVKEPKAGPDVTFWPDQVLKDSVAALGVLAAVVGLAVYYHGAELTAPADPANNYAAARPEWYFLFLFQFLKWFPGQMEVWGAFIIPGVVVGVLFLMPWIGRWKVGHVFNVLFLFVLLGGAALLTVQAICDDTMAGTADATFEEYKNKFGKETAEENKQAFAASLDFLKAKRDAQHAAERVIALARSDLGIPPTGALALVYDDPYLQGPLLFKQYCASCHNYVDWKNPDPLLSDLVNPAPTAPNLHGVGSRKWAAALLDPEQVGGPDYLGYPGSPFVGDGDNTEMVEFVQECFGEDLPAAEREKVEAAFQKIAMALSAEAKLPAQAAADADDQRAIAEGRALMEGGLADLVESGSSCTDCHPFGKHPDDGESPVLDGYMSRQWMIDFVRNPEDARFYGDINDRMPAFAPHEDPQLNQLDEKTLGLIVDWLRGDWYRPVRP
ncbi:MAG: cytochrome bc complex cytochrome b subunit [Pirellulales bacterium]|nr:cytochrome bc complex cytochrome b subunit [Pirellulales bacterium]